jgi:hypothetical protein
LEQLRLFRNMAERHVRDAARRATLTAAADPADFIESNFITEFVDQANVSWDEGRNLIYSLVDDLPAPIFQSVVNAAVKDAASYYDQILRTLITKSVWGREPIYGEFMKGELVQYGDIRPLLVRLGGGSTDAQVPLMGGITSGNTMSNWLSANGIDSNKKIWLYGYEDEPRRTFNGHLQMDGLVFERWDDDGLRIAPQDAWLRRTHYQPGDHKGCACIVAPYLPNFGEDYILETPSV